MMKRLTIRTIAALLTFFIGVSAATLWFVFRHPSLPQSKNTNSQPIEKPAFLNEVLYDFRFVGSGVAASQVLSHGIEAQPLPQKFESGHQYIFHRCVATDNDQLFGELQSRLRSKGINILNAEQYGWAYIDGLRFRISFQDEEYKGHIKNALDERIASDTGQLRRQCFVDDYILVIEEAR